MNRQCSDVTAMTSQQCLQCLPTGSRNTVYFISNKQQINSQTIEMANSRAETSSNATSVMVLNQTLTNCLNTGQVIEIAYVLYKKPNRTSVLPNNFKFSWHECNLHAASDFMDGHISTRQGHMCCPVCNHKILRQ